MSDEVEEDEKGTALTAELLNSWRQNIIDSKAFAKDAKDIADAAAKTAEDAAKTAGDAEINANTANENSSQARTMATDAKVIADQALNHVTNKTGTVVTISGNSVLTFDADQKVNVSDYNTAQEALNQRVVAVESSALMTKVTYDAETDTFSI